MWGKKEILIFPRKEHIKSHQHPLFARSLLLNRLFLAESQIKGFFFPFGKILKKKKILNKESALIVIKKDDEKKSHIYTKYQTSTGESPIKLHSKHSFFKGTISSRDGGGGCRRF